MKMPGMDKEIITNFLEQSTATAKGHMVGVQKPYAQHTATNRLSQKYIKR